MEDTLLKRTVRAMVSRDLAPIKALRLLADKGQLLPEHQAIVAEHYGLSPSFGVMGVLRELAAEL